MDNSQDLFMAPQRHTHNRMYFIHDNTLCVLKPLIVQSIRGKYRIPFLKGLVKDRLRYRSKFLHLLRRINRRRHYLPHLFVPEQEEITVCFDNLNDLFKNRVRQRSRIPVNVDNVSDLKKGGELFEYPSKIPS